jgi:hypothetical protein
MGSLLLLRAAHERKARLAIDPRASANAYHAEATLAAQPCAQ